MRTLSMGFGEKRNKTKTNKLNKKDENSDLVMRKNVITRKTKK